MSELPKSSPSPLLRIGIDGRSLCGTRTGVGTYTSNLLSAMLEQDPALHFLLFSAEEIPAFHWLDARQVELSRSDRLAGNNFLWTNITLRRLLLRTAAGIFHSPNYTLPLWPSCPTIVTLHDVSYAAEPRWYPYRAGLLRKVWYRAAALKANAILTDSEFSRREIVRVYRMDEAKIHVVYLGVNASLFKPRVSGPRQLEFRSRYNLFQDFVLFVGDIHPRRNVVRMVEAIRTIRRSQEAFKRLELVLAGRILGTGRGASESRALCESDGVRFLGYVPEEDLPGLYDMAQALLYPSFYEGFGLPVLEAMASGCPAIVSRDTACSEIAGGAALSVDPTSVPSIVEAILGVLTNEELRNRCRELGLARSAQFTWESAARQTLAIYRKVAERGRT